MNAGTKARSAATLTGLMVIGIFVCATLACTTGNTTASPESFSDADARTLVNGLMKNFDKGRRVITLGAWSMRKHTPFDDKLQDGQMFPDLFEAYKYLDKIGILEVKITNDYRSNKFSDWSQWNKQWAGVAFDFIALPGPKFEYSCPMPEMYQPNIADWAKRRLNICIPYGSGSVEKIIRNEPVSVGVDRYRLVMATYKWNWNPVNEEISGKIDGRPESSDRKMSALFKYDPFAGIWKIALVDLANFDEDFRTRRTFDFVEQHPQGSPKTGQG